MIEQRNSTLVRAHLGYGRLARPQQAQKLSRLYHNLFQPVMHLVEKTYVPETGRTKRDHDQAMIPLDRLLALRTMDAQPQQSWEEKRQVINPLQMRETIYALRDHLLSLPATTGPGDVRTLLTLLYPLQVNISLQEAARPR